MAGAPGSREVSGERMRAKVVAGGKSAANGARPGWTGDGVLVLMSDGRSGKGWLGWRTLTVGC